MDQQLTNLPVELLRIICEYCDNEALLNLQAVDRKLRDVAGAFVWNTIRIDGPRGIVTLQSASLTKSLSKFYEAVMDGMLSVPCGWIKKVMITTPDDSMEASNSEASTVFGEHARMTQALMIEVIPPYFTKMERLEILSSSSTDEGTCWPAVLSEMFEQIPDVTKYLRLSCQATSYDRPLRLVNVQILTLRVSNSQQLQALIGSEFPSALVKLDLTINSGSVGAEWFQYATTNCNNLTTLHMNCQVHNPTMINWIPTNVTELTQPFEWPTAGSAPIRVNNITTLRISTDMDSLKRKMIFNMIYPNITRLHLKVSSRQPEEMNFLESQLIQCCQKVTTLHVNGATLKYLEKMLFAFPNVEILIVESVVLYMFRDSRGLENTQNASAIKHEMNNFAQSLGQYCKKLKSFYLNRPELGDYNSIMKGIYSIQQQCPHLHEIYLGSARRNECKASDGWVAVQDKTFATVCQGVDPNLTFQTYRLMN